MKLAVAIDVRRRKIDSQAFQQAKALESLADLLNQLGQICVEFVRFADTVQSPSATADFTKLVRRVRKSLSLLVVDPNESSTRQGLKFV